MLGDCHVQWSKPNFEDMLKLLKYKQLNINLCTDFNGVKDTHNFIPIFISLEKRDDNKQMRNNWSQVINLSSWFVFVLFSVLTVGLSFRISLFWQLTIKWQIDYWRCSICKQSYPQMSIRSPGLEGHGFPINTAKHILPGNSSQRLKINHTGFSPFI